MSKGNIHATWIGNKPIIFLDWDGVINVDGRTSQNLILLKSLVDKTGSKIVLSSTRRIGVKPITKVDTILSENGIPYHLDIIPHTSFMIDHRNRASEIEKWLKLNPNSFSTFVIFDDKDSNLTNLFPNHYLKTNNQIGLTSTIISKALSILDISDSVSVSDSDISDISDISDVYPLFIYDSVSKKTAYLPNYQLLQSNIIPEKGKYVLGDIVYLTKEELDRLDNDKPMYQRVVVSVSKSKRETLNTYIYIKKKKSKPEGIFTYGTLRADYSDKGDKWGVCGTNCQWQYGEVDGFQLYQQPGLNYPYAIKSSRGSLKGTFITWKKASTFHIKLHRCNEIEGYRSNDPHSLYQRTIVDVKLSNGEYTTAYIYYQTKQPDKIDIAFPTGDWFS